MPKLTRKQKRLYSQISDGTVQLKQYKPKEGSSKFVVILPNGQAIIPRQSDVTALIDRGLIKENKEKL